MRHAEIAIVGGGLAGSTAAVMLGRADHDAILIDPHPIYPDDFRCEKLDASQIALLRMTGVAEAVHRAATIDQEVWIGRSGRIVERRPSAQLDILYGDLVNVIRAEIPRAVDVIHGKVTAISTSAEHQQVTLSTGEQICARLVVLANGLNIGLRESLGIRREVTSPCHSISIGFWVKPIERGSFPFRALTYYTENASSRVAYVTMFPIGSMVRANLFVYRDMHDPWLREMRRDGQVALFGVMPRLRALTGDVEIDDVKIRPVDLYVSKGYRQPGIVLVGDAFGTSCPAAGTGCNKVFTDVVRLCETHIPRWMATPGMESDKIATFYDDAVKIACERFCTDKAYYLRSFCTDGGLAWRARRIVKFFAHLGRGALRQTGERLLIKPAPHHGAPARSGAR